MAKTKAALSFALCITAITLLPAQGFQDQIILLPAIFMILFQWKQFSSGWISKALLATGSGALLWPWLAAVGVILARPLLTKEAFYSKAVFALPLRTTPVFPFVLLGVLALGLRRASRSDSRFESLSNS